MSSRLLSPPFQNNTKSIYIILWHLFSCCSHTDGCWGYQARRTKTLRFYTPIGWENERLVIWPIVYWMGGWSKLMHPITLTNEEKEERLLHIIWKWRLFQYGVCCRGRKWQWNLLDSWQYPFIFAYFCSMSRFKLVILFWFGKHKG